MNKYYCDFSNLNILTESGDIAIDDDFIMEYEDKMRQAKDLQFVIRATKSDMLQNGFTERVKAIIKKLNEESIPLKNISIVVDNNFHYTYTNSEWKIAEDINREFANENITFGFDDVFNTFSIEQVNVANKKIESTANKIKEKNLSPYEKLMAAYLKVASKKYLVENENEDPSMSRSVYGILNSDKIVCIGYASWLKAIIEATGDENIKVYPNFVKCSDDNETLDDMHGNTVVYVKDEKYGIDGYYYCDPTWDCTKKDDDARRLCYFMLPLEDINKLSSTHIRAINSKLINKEKKFTRDKSERKLFHEKDPAHISFSEDGILPCSEFLSDLLKNSPELIDEIPKAYCDAVLKNQINPDLARYNNTVRALEYYVNIFKSANVTYLTKHDLVDFSRTLYDSISTNNYANFKKLSIELIEKYSKTDTEQKQIIDELYENIKTYHNDEIVRLKKLIDIAQKTVSRIELEQNPSKNDKKILEATQPMIKKCEKKLAKHEKTANYVDELKKLFKESPNLAKVYAQLNSFKNLDQRFISILNNSQTPAEFTDSVVKTLTREGEESVFDCLNEYINTVNNRIAEEKTKDLKRVKRILDGENCYDQIIDGSYSCAITNSLILKAMLKTSKPVELAKTRSALKLVLHTFNPNLTKPQIEEEVNSIVSFNAKESKSLFEPNASNAFYDDKIINEK